MHLLGFSLNTLSLFGLVLSIGIVVDDAIVVVENVERHLANGGSARDAARAAMTEVTGPIVAITSVLAAVFVPTAFLGGLQGAFYRQFALTVAISTVLSAVNSLTLSPALAAILLRPHGAPKDRLSRIIDRGLGWIYRPFNRFFERAAEVYGRSVRRIVRASAIVLMLYVGSIALTYAGFARVPTGFVPPQDKYFLVGVVQLPAGSSLDRTEAVAKEFSKIALAEPGIENVVGFPGLSINGFVNAPNAAVLFVMLDSFEARATPGLAAAAISGRLQQKLGVITDGFVGVFPPPPVPGLGATGGFKLQLEDRGGVGMKALHEASTRLAERASRDPALAGVMSTFEANVPQIDLDVDRTKAKMHGVSLSDVFESLQINLGSLYVNDLNRFGRTYQVNVQADARHRMDMDAIARLEVRNRDGKLLPLGTITRPALGAAPDRVMHHNGYASIDVTGGPAPGYSSGQAVLAMERIAKETLPAGVAFEWTELTYQQKLAGDAALFVFPLCVLLAFLILAAQYDSWSMPLTVLLIVPLCLLSAIGGVWLAGGDNNVFTQIGLVVLVGLASKNAILIVEFARSLEEAGMSPTEAAIEASRLRLRPILMTSIAFVMGVVPLMRATGAGAEMRHAMGVAVFAGMLGVTLFGLVLTPVFYVAGRKVVLRWQARRPSLDATAGATEHAS